ncbi:Bifunctional protein GAL10 [Escovopsis weberi]|uniref:Bifunctional protein GAL10 n=1 Tax=Escovopsis weberi TaxID=150374 RepID=A0A0M9VT49_ESCWE|nr:Bifunctional protein GAL10 [Escovopsis weberi]
MAESCFAFLPLGAIIQSFKVKGIDIVLNFPKQEDYIKHNAPYFGETIGRYANRIKGAQITLNGGQSYPLGANEGLNTLHGGYNGWGKHVWKGPEILESRSIPGIAGLQGGETVRFTHVSEDGDEGFPGTVEMTVTYTTGTLDHNGKEAMVLAVDYEAKLLGGADETAINLTNHSYFNLTGDATTEGTVVTLSTNQHLPVDAQLIPTGGPVPFSELDVTKPFTLGVPEPFIDHCFVTNPDPTLVPIDTREETLLLNAEAHHPKSGVHLQVFSTEPSFQFYTGKFIDVPAVDDAPARGSCGGFACEPSRWVNAINVPEWRGMALLKKGETYGSRIVYKAWAD